MRRGRYRAIGLCEPRLSFFDDNDVKKGEGIVSRGKKIGDWYYKTTSNQGQDLESEDGPYVDGKRHGPWVRRDLACCIAVGSTKAPIWRGKSMGHWVEREDSVRSVSEGPYVEGKRHGKWVWRFPNGAAGGGSYVNGKKHGHWVDEVRGSHMQQGDYEDYTIQQSSYKAEGLYEEGKKQGLWVEHYRDGGTDEGSYVNDKRHGQWVERRPVESKKNREKVTVRIYENGKYVRTDRERYERRRRKK